MRHIKILFPIILSIYTISIYGQNIVGKVVDENNAPLEFVNIVALSNDSTFMAGTISHAEGNFAITLSGSKKAQWLRFSFVGYANRILSYTTDDVGTIVLTPLSQVIQETVVSASRPVFQLTTEGIETNVASSLLSVAGTANDVLSKLPNVEGSNGEFSVFGKGTALLYLNGRQIYDTSVLDRLSSMEIQSVEVITNPGAKYDNTIKAVIKIKTKKKVGDGFSGVIQGAYAQSHRSGYNGMAYLNFREKGLDVFGSVYYNNNYLKQEQNETQNIYQKSQQNNDLSILSHFQYISGTAGVNYEFNQKHSLGFTYTIDKRPGDAWLDNSMEITQLGSNKESLKYKTNNEFPSGINHMVNGYYNGNVKNLSIDLNFDYVFRKNQNEQITKEYDGDLILQGINTHNDANGKMFASKLILGYPIGKGKLNVGGEYTYTRRINTFTNEQEILNASDDKIKENTVSGFAEYGLQWNNWKLNAGIRYQATRSDYYEREVLIDKQSKDYHDLLPSLSIGTQIGKVQTQLNYAAKKTRPAYYMLNSNVQYNNRFNYEGGNPLLQPATHHDLTLSAVYKWLNLSASYLYKKDEMIRIDKPYGDEAIMFTFDNFKKIQEFNAQISILPKIGFWQPMYSVSIGKQFFDNKKLLIDNNLNQPIFRFKLNNSFSLPYSVVLRVDFYAVTKGNVETYLYKSYSNLSFSLTKSFCKNKLFILLSASDILKDNYSKSIFYGSYMRNTRNNYSDTRKVQMTLRYFFNMSQSKYKGTGAGTEEKSRL